MTGQKKICVIGLNPAWQKTLVFRKFEPGKVNRTESLRQMCSGKGINFARAVRCWNLAQIKVLQFAGGANGRRLVEDMEREGFSHRTVETAGETRTCTTVLCRTGHTMTELIEPSAVITAQELAEFRKAAAEEIAAADAVAICGTYPPGLPDDLYSELAEMAAKQQKTVLIDAVKGIEGALKAGYVTMIKINREELAGMTGETDPENAVRKCFRTYPLLKYLAVTDGKDPAIFADAAHLEYVAVPEIEEQDLKSPLGSGDTCSAVTLSELVSGREAVDAFRYGQCAASANCLSDLPAVFLSEKVYEFYRKTFMQEK